jgi:meso-butanediol dehydrogenase/(S,S)-butanediol dehydrogenase/diacetyl reductase
VDVANLTEVESFIQAGIDRFGRLDVLINNAGMGSFGTVDQLPPETWRQVLGVNLDSVFFGARCAVPHLAKTGGCIINTASISGLGGDYGFAAYNAAKAGVINLTRTLAMDHAHQGIRVNAVCPGLVLTPIAAALHQTPQIMDAYRQMIPMGRACEPDEIARPILFLASSAASYITGEALVIDGGVRASAGQPNFKTLLAPLLEQG